MTSRSDPQKRARLIYLCAAHLDDTITSDEAAELGAALRRDPPACRLMVELAGMLCLMEGVSVYNTMDAPAPPSVLQPLKLKPEDPAYLSHVADLLHTFEQTAELQVISQLPDSRFSIARVSPLNAWLTRHMAVLIAAAACVAFSALLVLVFGFSNSSPGSQPGAANNMTDHVSPPNDVVAEVIALSPEVIWGNIGNSPRPGQSLKPGLLALERGQAEVRFANGSSVEMVAGTRLQVIDGGSSRLLSGSIRASVPESGHGFKVHFAGGIVTDLGTRFDMTTSEDQGTRISVTEGSVAVTPVINGTHGKPHLLTQNQFAVVSSDGLSTKYYQHVNQIIKLDVPSTGKGLKPGEQDPTWTIIDSGEEVPAVVTIHNGAVWLKGDPESSQWLSYKANLSEDRPHAPYSFKTQLTIPDGVDPDSVRLIVRYLADDALTSVRVNGILVNDNIPLPRPDLSEVDHSQYQTWSELEIAEGFQPGGNELRFEVLNKKRSYAFRAELSCTAMLLFEVLGDPTEGQP